jgi:hypothetical protein
MNKLSKGGWRIGKLILGWGAAPLAVYISKLLGVPYEGIFKSIGEFITSL